MQRSPFARYAARPRTAFPVPVSTLRGPRLGLRRQLWFSPVERTVTVLQRAEHGPVALLRPEWGTVTAARSASGSGHPAPVATVRWAKVDGRATGRRTRAASAPWRG